MSSGGSKCFFICKTASVQSCCPSVQIISCLEKVHRHNKCRRCYLHIRYKNLKSSSLLLSLRQECTTCVTCCRSSPPYLYRPALSTSLSWVTRGNTSLDRWKWWVPTDICMLAARVRRPILTFDPDSSPHSFFCLPGPFQSFGHTSPGEESSERPGREEKTIWQRNVGEQDRAKERLYHVTPVWLRTHWIHGDGLETGCPDTGQNLHSAIPAAQHHTRCPLLP